MRRPATYDSIPLLSNVQQQPPMSSCRISKSVVFIILFVTALSSLFPFIQLGRLESPRMHPVLRTCFEENKQIVADLNAKHQHLEFKLGKFSNICLHDYPQKRLRGKGKLPKEIDLSTEWFDGEKHFFTKKRLGLLGLDHGMLPDEFDWSNYIDFPIKDQGHYSSCWTFSATETAEVAHWIAGHELPRISEQHLLDCLETTQNEDGDWCSAGECGYIGWDKGYGGTGGFAEDAMIFWSRHGYVSANLYPYTHGICKGRQELPPGVERTEENLKANCVASDFCNWNEENLAKIQLEDYFTHLATQICENITPKVSPCHKDVETAGSISGIVLVSYNPDVGVFKSTGMDEELMKEALYKLGPLSIQANANPFMHYHSGIANFNEEDCDPTDLDHVLQLVGYGTENGVDYWKIRNSWGPFWGEKGYFRVKRGGNICGVAAEVFAAYI